MPLFNLNTQITSAVDISPGQNRAFQYGDGLFETIRMIAGQIPMLSYHLDRLHQGADFLGLELPAERNQTFWQQEITKLCTELEAEPNRQNFRIRLQVFRENGGLYTPQQNKAGFLIQTSPLPKPQFSNTPPGLHLGLFDRQAIAPAPLSNFKTCNSLVYILAAQYAQDQGYDECLLLNAFGQPVEGYCSNLFLLQKDTWLTPPLSAGGVAGTFRAFLIDHAKELGLHIETKELHLSDIENARAIWLTNAIQGIRWVKRYKSLTFDPMNLPEVIRRLNQICTEPLK